MKKKIPDALMGTFYASFAYHENTQTLVLQSEHTSEVGGACISFRNKDCAQIHGAVSLMHCFSSRVPTQAPILPSTLQNIPFSTTTSD